MKEQTPLNSHHYIAVKKAVEKVMRIRDLQVKSRVRYIAHARFLYMAISEEMLGDNFRLSNCGYYINRDHSDVVHGLHFVRNNLKDPCWIGSFYYVLICEELGIISKDYIELSKGKLRDTKWTTPRYQISTKEKYSLI